MLPILMQSASGHGPADLAVTENVSSRGVRVMTKRLRKPGELCQLCDLSGYIRLPARVILRAPSESQLLHRTGAKAFEAKLVGSLPSNCPPDRREKQRRGSACRQLNYPQGYEKIPLARCEPFTEERSRNRSLARTGSFSTGS